MRRRPFKLHIHADSAKNHITFLRARLRAAHRFLGSPLRELSLALVDAATMKRVHRRFFGLNSVTDVITFELDQNSNKTVIAGEIIVCVAIARRQMAGSGSQSLRRELLLYALHGMLHLCGFDDSTRSGFKAMHAMEDKILTRLGIGPVFDPNSARDKAARRNGASCRSI